MSTDSETFPAVGPLDGKAEKKKGAKGGKPKKDAKPAKAKRTRPEGAPPVNTLERRVRAISENHAAALKVISSHDEGFKARLREEMDADENRAERGARIQKTIASAEARYKKASEDLTAAETAQHDAKVEESNFLAEPKSTAKPCRALLDDWVTQIEKLGKAK